MAATARKPAAYRKTKRLKAPQRRRMILVAAQSLLVEGGFSALTLRSTAQAAGVRLATLQYYFPNRESLFNAAFEDVTNAAWDELLLQSKMSLTQNPTKQLGEFLAGLVATTKDELLAGMFIELWAAARTHEFAATLMHRYYEQATALLESLIKQAFPELGRSVRKQRAVLVMSVIEGLTLFNQMDLRRRVKPGVTDRQALNSLVAIVESGT